MGAHVLPKEGWARPSFFGYDNDSVTLTLTELLDRGGNLLDQCTEYGLYGLALI